MVGKAGGLGTQEKNLMRILKIEGGKNIQAVALVYC